MTPAIVTVKGVAEAPQQRPESSSRGQLVGMARQWGKLPVTNESMLARLQGLSHKLGPLCQLQRLQQQHSKPHCTVISLSTSR